MITATPTTQTIQSCKHSACTLFLPKPYWLEAWESPWVCWMQSEPRLIADTGECTRCPNWTAGSPKLPDGAYFC